MVSSEDLVMDRKNLLMRRAVVAPAWEDEKVLTSDKWTYVDLWLRRNGSSNAVFYWEQAREFYRASLGLPVTAAPLTLYYCFLNATKALLTAKGVAFTDKHGLTGNGLPGKASLSKEQIILKGSGILPALMGYYREALTTDTYTLKEVFSNLAFIHRAYCLSYQESYLFFSLQNCRYTRKIGSTEAWFTGYLEDRFDDQRILATLPVGFERDIGVMDALAIRKKQRFQWARGKSARASNLSNLTNYHRRSRRNITYIAGVGSWYLKRLKAGATVIDRHAPTLIFAAMHRLSELSRYEPIRLSKLLDTQRNWLLAEFIKTAPIQFIDEIACELTGQEISVPGIHASTHTAGA